MWLIHRCETDLRQKKTPHVSSWIHLSCLIRHCCPDNADRRPDCNLQSRPRLQTDVRGRFTSLDLVQDQRRWAYVQSPTTALIYQNQNQPDAAGLVRLICHQLLQRQTLRRCKMSDLQKSRQPEFELHDLITASNCSGSVCSVLWRELFPFRAAVQIIWWRSLVFNQCDVPEFKTSTTFNWNYQQQQIQCHVKYIYMLCCRNVYRC